MMFMRKLSVRFSFILSLLLLAGCNSMAMYNSFSVGQVERAGMEEKVLTLDNGGRLHYWDRGEGEPVLFIHGLGSNAMMNWKEQMLNFNAHYRVVAPDLLWFGSSGSPSAKRNLHSQAEAMFELMDHLGIKKAHVAGHSYGGFVGYKMMDLHPQRLDSLTMISSPGPAMSDDELTDLTERFSVDRLEMLFVPETSQGLKKLNEGIFAKAIPTPGFVYRDIHQYFFEPHKQSQRTLVETLPDERENLLSTYKKELPPVFLIWGAKDQIFPLDTGINLSRHLKAPIAIIDDGAHALPFENPDDITELLNVFLSKPEM